MRSTLAGFCLIATLASPHAGTAATAATGAPTAKERRYRGPKRPSMGYTGRRA